MGTPGPPNNSMGASSYFYCQVLPATVNFWKVSFEETIPQQIFTSPSGYTLTQQDETAAYHVEDMCSEPNWYGDVITSYGFWSRGVLFVPNSNPPAYDDWRFDVLISHEFMCVCGWIDYVNRLHPRHFRAADFMCRVASGGEWGGWQGPYTDLPPPD